MAKKLFLIIMVVCPLLIGQAIRPRIAVQEVEHDFGSSAGSYTFLIYNSGGGVLKISKIRTTCSCVTTSLEKNEIAMADSSGLTVTFSGTRKKGPMLEYIYIKSNDETTPELRLTVASDKHIPPLIFPNLSSVDTSVKQRPPDSPIIFWPETSHNFGEMTKGNVVGYNFKIINKGKSTLVIKRVRTSCGCTAALVSNNKIEPGESSELHVEFDSSTENGKVRRIIEVVSNDPGAEKSILNIYAEVKPGSK
ncbi:MAG: DUF1573 domain-containing protein [Ignavibacteriaceae bacterium]